MADSSDDAIPKIQSNIERLVAVMARLRDPITGCPWDIEQDFASIAPYTIEEAYEVAEAIEQGDMAALKEELGDLLLQVVYHARMAEEAGAFDFDRVAAGISDKMIRRHPHVFGADSVESAAAQTRSWEAAKAAERSAKAQSKGEEAGLLDGVAQGLPAMTRALKLQARAARVGFDWPNAQPVVLKIEEELSELKEEMRSGEDLDALADEFGDLLFVMVNLSRHLKIEPEAALRRTNAKFCRRFSYIERHFAAKGMALDDVSLEEMEAAWQMAKAKE